MSNTLEKQKFTMCPVCELIHVKQVSKCSQCGYDISEEIDLFQGLEGIIYNFRKIQLCIEDKYEIQELEGLITQTEAFKDEREKAILEVLN